MSIAQWSVLQMLPYSERYGLYKSWEGIGLHKTGAKGSTPFGGKCLPILKAEGNAWNASRRSLKRLTKDNVDTMGKESMAHTHANPLVVYNLILTQIESYDNVIEFIVKALRDAGQLRLADPRRPRIQPHRREARGRGQRRPRGLRAAGVRRGGRATP